MRLNLSKCKGMHIEYKNKCSYYLMKSYFKDEFLPILKTELKKAWGMIISKDFKFTVQSNKAASNANRMLGLFKRTF